MRPLVVYEDRKTVLLLVGLSILAVLAVPLLLYSYTADWRVPCATPQSLTTNGGLQGSRWASRFIIAAIVQAAMAAGLTAFLLFRGALGKPPASTIIAAGGAGNWLTIGYFGYLILGLLASGVMAFFYGYIEVELGRPYWGWMNFLAWAHLVLMNGGVVGATWLMMHAGYRGGVAALPPKAGGQGMTPSQLHTMLKGYPPFIAAFMGMALVGVLLGCLGYLMALMEASGLGPICP